MQTKNTKQGGFTLVEIAIVLVIIGLLLGGILKGQELINNAKVRSVADRQNSLKAAWFGFVDRYNFIPGDSKRAIQLVPEAQARGDVDNPSRAGDGRLSLGESVLAMQNLTGAGFLRCPQCNGLSGANTSNTNATIPPDAENSLVNQYSGIMSIWNESNQYAARGVASTSEHGRLQIHSGPRIPSNILGEVDRKIDDGSPNSGDMVFNAFDPTTTIETAVTGSDVGIDSDAAPLPTACMSQINNSNQFAGPGILIQPATNTNDMAWRSADAAGGAVENNCGASIFI